MSFENLKKGSSLDRLKKSMDSMNTTKKSYKDDRFWQPEVDTAGNGYAVIRFLDTPEVDGVESPPYITLYSHGFKGPGGWYIENSLTTIDLPDPVSEYNTALWTSGLESNKKLVSIQKRKLNYISNVLVVTDPKHPENEGKIFLYKYGAKIFEKIKSKSEPEFPDEKKFNPFDYWTGANFKLKIRSVKQGDGPAQRNYDLSEFDSQSPLFDNDDKIKAVWSKSYSLKDFHKPENFKTYDVLKAKLDRVVGAGGAAGSVATKTKSVFDQNTETPAPTPKASSPRVTAEETILDDDDEDMSFFARLAE